MTAQLTAEDYTPDDGAALLDLITELLSGCSTLILQHAPEGTWHPRSDDVLRQLTEASELIGEMSRQLSKTRGHIREIDARARQRFYTRVHVPTSLVS